MNWQHRFHPTYITKEKLVCWKIVEFNFKKVTINQNQHTYTTKSLIRNSGYQIRRTTMSHWKPTIGPSGRVSTSNDKIFWMDLSNQLLKGGTEACRGCKLQTYVSSIFYLSTTISICVGMSLPVRNPLQKFCYYTWRFSTRPITSALFKIHLFIVGVFNSFYSFFINLRVPFLNKTRP